MLACAHAPNVCLLCHLYLVFWILDRSSVSENRKYLSHIISNNFSYIDFKKFLPTFSFSNFRTDQSRMENSLQQIAHVPSRQESVTNCPLTLQRPPPPQQLLHSDGDSCHSCCCDSRSMLILHNRHRSAVRLKTKLKQVCHRWWWQRYQSFSASLLKAFLPSRPSTTALLYNLHLIGAVIFLLLAIQPCQGKNQYVFLKQK